MPVPRSFSLSQREADIAITTERPSEGRLVAVKLVDYTLGLFAAKTYAEAHGLPAPAAELAAHRLVGYVPDLVITPSLDYAAEFSPDWSAGFMISSALGQAEAVRSGAGIGILHNFVARAMPELVAVAARLRRSAAPTGWSTMEFPALRRIQAVAGFITKAVEREKALFV